MVLSIYGVVSYVRTAVLVSLDASWMNHLYDLSMILHRVRTSCQPKDKRAGALPKVFYFYFFPFAHGFLKEGAFIR